jgi:hypothetical protein
MSYDIGYKKKQRVDDEEALSVLTPLHLTHLFPYRTPWYQKKWSSNAKLLRHNSLVSSINSETLKILYVDPYLLNIFLITLLW